MVAIPGTFNDDDAAMDPVAGERMAMHAILSGCSAALILAAKQMRALSQQARRLGDIGDHAAQLAAVHAVSIESIVKLLNSDAAKVKD